MRSDIERLVATLGIPRQDTLLGVVSLARDIFIQKLSMYGEMMAAKLAMLAQPI
jgi:hypothetical protein